MSSAYSTEPVTDGKVLLKTTVGDIEVELWSKQAPLACRNFVTLVLRAAFDNTLFERILSGFIVQHSGSAAVEGPPLKAEPHPRIKYNHRGQVAMVKGSRTKWFITLGPAEHLRTTIFGKVAGETIFNVLRLGAVPTNEDDAPVYPVKITSAEVIHNPFQDIVAENLEKIVHPQDQAVADSASVAAGGRVKRKAVRNKGLLSFSVFGDDDDEEESGEEDEGGENASGHDASEKRPGQKIQIRLKSSHDRPIRERPSIIKKTGKKRKRLNGVMPESDVLITSKSGRTAEDEYAGGTVTMKVEASAGTLGDDKDGRVQPHDVHAAGKGEPDLGKLARFAAGAGVFLGGGGENSAGDDDY